MTDPSASGTAMKTASNESRGPTVLVITIIFTVLSFTFTLLRCISRLFVVGRWKLDDWFIVAAWLLAFGFSFSICWAVRNGLGMHSVNNPVQNEWSLRKAEFGFSVLYNPVLMCTKTSICIFYLAVGKNQRVFRWGVWATLVVVNLAGFALTLVNGFQCHPPDAILQETIPSTAYCIDIVAIYLASSPVNIITDMALLLLPMPMLTAMRMPRRQKIILIITFGFGLFVAVVDIVRIAYLQQAFSVRLNSTSTGGTPVTSEDLNVQDDFPWYAAYSFMWSAIEVHIGIMCANVPGLKPLVARLLPSVLYDTASQLDNATWRRKSPRNLFKRWWRGENTASDPLPSPGMPHNYGGGSRHANEPFDSAPSPPPLNPDLPLAHIRSHDFASDSEYPSSPVAKESSSENRPPSTAVVADEHPSSDTERPASGQLDATDESHPMDFVEFLTTPDTARPLARTTTFGTTTTMSPPPDANPTFFDFYNIGNRKCMTELSDRESLLPNGLVTILFFLWGLSYGMLEQLNTQFQTIARLSMVQTVANHSAYYGAYFIAAPTIGQLVLRKAGFKMTFICGLCIYGVGTLIFWPSAVLTSFPAFLCSNFVVGFGVSILETAANPFVALCGPSRYAETRLSISQGVQAVGTVVAPLLARKVLFTGFQSADGLVDVQWAYLAIALFDVALAVVFYYVPLPDASDEDFEAVRLLSLPENRRISEQDRKIPRHVYIGLGVAVFAMFSLVGGQEVVGSSFIGTITEVHDGTPSLKADDWQTIGYGAFALGRFATAALTAFVAPWIVLGFLGTGVVVFSSLAAALSGQTAAIMLIIFELFQGGMFPLIYAIGLRGLGRHTKWGAVLLTAAISGGAVWPVMSAGVDATRSWQLGLSLAAAAMTLVLIYPLYLGLYTPARHMVNPKALPAAGKTGSRRRRRSIGRKAQLRKQALDDAGIGAEEKLQAPAETRKRKGIMKRPPPVTIPPSDGPILDFEKELEKESRKQNLEDADGRGL